MPHTRPPLLPLAFLSVSVGMCVSGPSRAAVPVQATPSALAAGALSPPRGGDQPGPLSGAPALKAVLDGESEAGQQIDPAPGSAAANLPHDAIPAIGPAQARAPAARRALAGRLLYRTVRVLLI